MSILRRTYQPAEPDPAPVAAVQTARVSRAWAATIALLTLIVFTMFWAQTTLLVALIVAVTAAVGGGVLLTLMFGTGWITQRRRRIPDLPRYR